MPDFIEYIKNQGISCFANQNISEIGLNATQLNSMEKTISTHFRMIMEALLIDVSNDPNTQDTPDRVAKMMVREIFKGRFEPRPKMTTFPNSQKVNEIFTIGPISIKSACSHHFVPFIGDVWIGIIPSDKLLGLSKFARLTHWVMARPHIQEEAIKMLADEIEEVIKPQGLAIVMKAKHLCMSWRGVEENCAEMTSSLVRGSFKNPETRNEFFKLIEMKK